MSRKSHKRNNQQTEDRWPTAGMLVGCPPLTFLLVIVIHELGGTLQTPRMMLCSSQFLFCSNTSKTGIQSPERPKFDNRRGHVCDPSHSWTALLISPEKHFRCGCLGNCIWKQEPERHSTSCQVAVPASQLRPDEATRAERIARTGRTKVCHENTCSLPAAQPSWIRHWPGPDPGSPEPCRGVQMPNPSIQINLRVRGSFVLFNVRPSPA